MNLRAKLFPASVVACAAALAAISFAHYRHTARAVGDALRADAQARAHRFARAVEAHRDARLSELVDFSDTQAFDKFWVVGDHFWAPRGGPETNPARAVPPAPPGPITSANVTLSDDLKYVVGRFFGRTGKLYSAVSLFTGPGGSVVVRFEPSREEWKDPIIKRGELPAGVKSFPALFAEAVEEKWNVKRAAARGGLVYIVTVSWEMDGPVGYVVAEMRPDVLVAPAAEDQGGGAGRAGAAAQSPFQLIALDRERRLIYHTTDALKFRQVSDATPYFDAVAAEMAAGHDGVRAYASDDGARWLAAYAPVRGLDLSVAAAANETAATAASRREAAVYVALSVLFALAVSALVFAREARSARRIARIADAAHAVAEGDLDRRLEVGERDRTRSIAESFNLMTARLREHIRREAEDRQFQAFMRLSATLTHDLKNAITGLSMLVGNMEQRWEREEFRADAVASVREATEKLRGIVARLSKPTETLSGEYRSALKTVDLSKVVRRVVDATAGQSSFHEVEVQLPEGLDVVADVDRLERVFENLVINALEAMGANAGRLTVEGGHEGEQSVFITVADTGAGMTPEFIRTRLFRPFATTKKQGLGLGLYTCREVVEAHGGRIEVESRPSSGTRFRVVLPSRPVSLRRDGKP